jgi:hypothetical protein
MECDCCSKWEPLIELSNEAVVLAAKEIQEMNVVAEKLLKENMALKRSLGMPN